jgi:hypothetical protein
MRWSFDAPMPITITIKQVPERLARKLRARALGNHRSLQRELMVILEEAVAEPYAVQERYTRPYDVKPRTSTKTAPTHGPRMTLRELWARSRELGAASAGESTQIVRKLRDERHRR